MSIYQQIIDFDLTGDVAEYDGMVCGGKMQVLVVGKVC